MRACCRRRALNTPSRSIVTFSIIVKGASGAGTHKHARPPARPQLTDVLSAHMESLPKEVVVDHVLKRLQEIYPVAGTEGYKVVGSVVPRWYTNENFGGSYTNWPVRRGQGGLLLYYLLYNHCCCAAAMSSPIHMVLNRLLSCWSPPPHTMHTHTPLKQHKHHTRPA